MRNKQLFCGDTSLHREVKMLRIQLNDSEKSSLRMLARQEIGRVSERIHFVLMAGQGMSAPEIGEVMGYDTETVRTGLKRYGVSGVEGLRDQPRSGRPCKQRFLDSRVEAQISQTPDVNGYVQSVWTVALMALHLANRFMTAVSASTVRRALHRIRFAWKRPKLAPARRVDPDRAAKEARLAAVLDNPDPQINIVAVDECDCHLLAIVRSMWQRIGLEGQKRLPTPGQNHHRSVFGSFNLRTGLWHYCLRARKCTADFIVLLNLLLSACPVGTIYVIADNCKIHCSKALATWLVLNPRIQMVYLPTYSGHLLNPVEKVWWQLKRYIAANRNFRSLDDLDLAICRCLDSFLPAVLLPLCNSPVVRKALLALSISNVPKTFGD
jgi:transposase